MANKLLKPKRGRVENLPKLAVEDGSLIFAYDTKSPTSTVLVDVGETRYELSAATAKKADDSNALGGSSLQNIVDKIDNATGDGTAFTGLDTTTNNKVKLTRANGTTVEKTINNVSNASTADYAKVSNKIGTGTIGSSTKPVYINAGTPTAVSSIPSTFVAASQINGINLDTLRTPGMYWAGGGNTNTNKPTGIGAFGLEVLQSAAGWYTQICYASDDQEKQFVRYYNAGTKVWKDWIEQNRLNTKTQSGYAPAPNAANKVYRTDASGNPGWGTLNDSSIGKLASTVTLGDGNGAMIDQNGTTYRQRINIFDNATANDVVFSFQQSTDAGKTYKDLFAINDDGTVIAGTFQGALKGTADYSKNSGALGGSSLKNIVDKINNSTGDGTAFTDLDTTTNNKVKLTRANGSTVEKTINNVSNASSASFSSTATLAAYPQGFESRTTSATWGNTTGTFLTGWHTSSGGDVAFMNNNPSSGKVSMKLDGYFYQNEGTNRVLDTSDAANYVKKAGDTMTGLLTLKIGNQQGIKLGSAWMTSASSTNGEFVLQNGHLRFGASDWDYNKWAGLKYDAENKYVYLGIADGTIFTANKPQSGGLLFTPGISGIYIGGTTTTRVATSSDLSSYVAKSGDTMTGTLQVNAPIFGYRYGSNNDSPAFVFDKPGNHYTGIGAHGTDTIYFSAVNTSGLTWNHDYKQKWVFNGSVSATTVTADYFDGTIANATSAKNASHLGGEPSSAYALKTDLQGTINALSAKRLESYQSASVANSFFYRYGTAGYTSDGGAWTGFPSAILYDKSSTANGFGNALFRKKVGVLHLASGSSAHDLVFQAGGTNVGIAYVATGRNPAYILDTLNYKDKAYTFNKLTASSTFTATSGVVIDGGSY